MKSVKSPAAGNPPFSRWATEEKAFDCLKWTREARDEINAEIAGMSTEEELRWWEAQRPTDPFLAELWDESRAHRTRRSAASDAPPSAIAEP